MSSHHPWRWLRKDWAWIQCHGLTGWCLAKGGTRPSQRSSPPWLFLWFCCHQMQSCPCLFLLPYCAHPAYPACFLLTWNQVNTGLQDPKEREQPCAGFLSHSHHSEPGSARGVPGLMELLFHLQQGLSSGFSVLQIVKLRKSVTFNICPLRQYLISVLHQPKSWKQ